MDALVLFVSVERRRASISSISSVDHPRTHRSNGRVQRPAVASSVLRSIDQNVARVDGAAARSSTRSFDRAGDVA
jgi:hypothetical protein